MRKRLLPLVLLVFFSVPVFAQEPEIPVNIKADKLKYFEDSGTAEASGSVEVEVKRAKILADYLLLDTVSDVVTAEGHVRTIFGEYQGLASSLTYNSNSNTVFFRDFQAVASPKGVRGNIYLKSKTMVDDGKKMTGGPGTVTTCSNECAHYLLGGDQVDLYPDDHIEGRNVTMSIGKVPVFWLPYFYYDLKKQKKQNWDYGFNEVEGFFVKSAWNYPLGILLVDYMQKKGIGLGTNSNYSLGNYGLGAIYLYGIKEQDTGIFSMIEKISHEKKLNDKTTLKLNQSYVDMYRIPSGRINQTTFGLELNYLDNSQLGSLKLDGVDDRVSNQGQYNFLFNQSNGGNRTNYYLNYNFSKVEPNWLRKSSRFQQQLPLLGERLSMNLVANYYQYVPQAGALGQEKVEPLLELTGREKDFSWRLTGSLFFNLLQKATPGVQQYDFLEKKPEVQVNSNTLDLRLFKLQSSFGFGSYREVRYVAELAGRRDFAADRYQATLNANQTVPLGLGTDFSIGAGIDQFQYSSGDQLYALRESAGLITNLKSCFRNELTFRQGYTEGNTPFFFDQLNTFYHDIREKVTFYNSDKFSWSLEGGHNWQTNKYLDTMTNLMLAPNDKIRWTVNTGWDLENKMYKDLVSNFRVAPAKAFSLDLSVIEDMNFGLLKQGNVLYNLILMEGEPNQMKVTLGQVYDPTNNNFRVRDIMIAKDLHCWEMQVAYSDYRKEISVVFNLKAFPGEPLGFASSRGFYFDSIQKMMNELTPAGEVRRY